MDEERWEEEEGEEGKEKVGGGCNRKNGRRRGGCNR